MWQSFLLNKLLSFILSPQLSLRIKIYLSKRRTTVICHSFVFQPASPTFGPTFFIHHITNLISDDCTIRFSKKLKSDCHLSHHESTILATVQWSLKVQCQRSKSHRSTKLIKNLFLFPLIIVRY